ncbi:hypothetical protein I3760_03G085900 [Carya illinoinensis]|nr:hypothetical protein I3760_03G085900 [Carya illinoinensis]
MTQTRSLPTLHNTLLHIHSLITFRAHRAQPQLNPFQHEIHIKFISNNASYMAFSEKSFPTLDEPFMRIQTITLENMNRLLQRLPSRMQDLPTTLPPDLPTFLHTWRQHLQNLCKGPLSSLFNVRL